MNSPKGNLGRENDRCFFTKKDYQKIGGGLVGDRSIVDKSSAYGAKGPGFTSQWRQEFIDINCNICSVHLRK